MDSSGIFPELPVKRGLPLANDDAMSDLLIGAAAGFPSINVFRALANAPSLAPDYFQYFARLFQPLELDACVERELVLLIGKLSGCEYVWRQNVVVAKSLGISDVKISELNRLNLDASCFSAPEQAAFVFAKEVVELVEATDTALHEVEKHFSSRALTEILYVIGTYMFLSRLIRTGRIPLDETPAEVPEGFLKTVHGL